jgi:hypothetical protein
MMIDHDEHARTKMGLALAALCVLGFFFVVLTLSGCSGETASCWNDARGRYTSCEDARSDEINRELDKREHDERRK